MTKVPFLMTERRKGGSASLDNMSKSSLYKRQKERRDEDLPIFPPTRSEINLSVLGRVAEDQDGVEEPRNGVHRGPEILEGEDQASDDDKALTLLVKLLDICPLVNEGVGAIVDDSFTKCFEENPAENWNWNWYLFPLWCCGVLVRYLILFPVRLFILGMGWLIFLLLFLISRLFLRPVSTDFALSFERSILQFLACSFVASWTGVIKYHGTPPERRANQVFVANHTSMIDYIVLSAHTPFAVIMQMHGSWMGLVQRYILESMQCIGFSRLEAKDRRKVVHRLKDHVENAKNNPLLIFPEGTCVNNEYIVQFKKGAFELGITVIPIAIKYNNIFVDAYWHSRKQSFSQHLFSLMTSWAVVCDVWYMEPQHILQGEEPRQFAERIQKMIAKQAGLTPVDLDGLYKYYRPNADITERKRRAIAAHMKELTK